MKTLNRMIVAAATLALTACGSTRAMDGGAAEGSARGSAPAVVRVQNNNWSDVVVYAVNGTARVRLGLVTSMTRQSFRLPASAVSAGGQLRLFLDPIGSSTGHLSESVQVRPGQLVDMAVGSNLAVSFVSVF